MSKMQLFGNNHGNFDVFTLSGCTNDFKYSIEVGTLISRA